VMDTDIYVGITGSKMPPRRNPTDAWFRFVP